MKYFVTGGTGFIGSNLIRRLIQDGHRVNALVRDPEKAGFLSELGVGIVPGDLQDRKSISTGMAGVDGVFHLAAWYRLGIKDRRQAEEINVSGTRNVLEIMSELRIPRGVYTSSLAVFSDTGGRLPDEEHLFLGKHLSIYDQTKWEAHYLVAMPMMKKGLPLMIVSPGAVYGPDDPSVLGSSIRDYLMGKFPFVPLGAKVCWGYIDDIVDAHVRAMEKGKPGESYIIAGPPHSLTEVFELGEKMTGIKAPQIKIPPWMLKLLSWKMSFWEKIFDIPPRYRAESLRVIAGVTYMGDSNKAIRELGCSFRPLGDGLGITLKHEMKKMGMICN